MEKIPKTPYKVKKLQIEKAKELGVQIKASTNKKKKLDVFIAGKKIYSIGANGAKDYATYLEDKNTPTVEAEARRKNYIQRHSKEPKIDDEGLFTKSLYADEILWGKKKDNINNEARRKSKVVNTITKEVKAKDKLKKNKDK